ncbi:MAG: GNAT family N-acetyltransferase [Nitrospirota bacterium]
MHNQPPITFRTASAGDIPLMQDLSIRIWREHYPGIITREQIDYMLGKMYASEVMRDEIASKGYRYVIVSEGSVPIGYIAYRHDEAKQTVLISKLYLLPMYHGKGIGRRMLDHVKDDALKAGARTLYLFVNKNNVKAIAAYERFGFIKAVAVVSDIGGGFVMDDYRMELGLEH